jgi:multiple sugar transport system permease protein
MATIAQTARPSKEGRASPLKRQETRAALAFISPWFIGFLIFTAGPMVVSLGLSLTNYDVLNTPRFIGLKNYQDLLRDSRFVLSLSNSVYYTLFHVPLTIIVSLSLAMLLSQVGRAAGFFRTVFYLPSITPAVAVGVLWLWIRHLRHFRPRLDDRSELDQAGYRADEPLERRRHGHHLFGRAAQRAAGAL